MLYELESMLETNITKRLKGFKFLQAMKNRVNHEGIKCSPFHFQVMLSVNMKLEIANSVLQCTLTINMTIEEDFKRSYKH